MLDIAAALGSSYGEVSYMDFYRDVFPEGSFEKKGIFVDGKYNGIAVSIQKGGKQTKRLTVTDDLDAIEDMAATDDFCLMSPISYVGKSRKSENARFMYALAIDLDGVETLKQWQFFMEQVEREGMRCCHSSGGFQSRLTLFLPALAYTSIMSLRSLFLCFAISWSSWRS